MKTNILNKKLFFSIALLCYVSVSFSQNNGLINMKNSRSAIICNTPIGTVKWTKGFWGDEFNVLSNTSIWSMWNTWDTPEISHGFRNFEIAAGDIEGEHIGPPFHDGDMYKWLEAAAAVYAITKDKKIDALMDKFINEVLKAQRSDGYIHTPVIIQERNKGIDSHKTDKTIIGTEVGNNKEKVAFANRLNFETYNLGHLMTAAVVHYRATGKRTLLEAAIKATDFLCHFYETASAELARNAICPSHYMGVIEMYRTTGNPRYLKLAENLINIRGLVNNGTDDNQDRIPFREQYAAMGHAVRANYLYAGVADIYAETGENQLMNNLTKIWTDIVNHKMYITGGCGALYDGTSPDGTNYTPDSIQKVHQAYGRAYQLPNATAHNETCANIGNLLFNWRMFEVTGDAKYTDIVETELYNGILSGISLDGEKYFYTNPLRISKDFPYTLRWPKTREKYISCFCCPPNTLRTLCEAQNYAYTMSKGRLWCNIYGSSILKTKIGNGNLKVTQTTEYPYDGNITIVIDTVPPDNSLNTVCLRIPGWCDSAAISVNGVKQNVEICKGKYSSISRRWKNGDKIQLMLDMHPQLIEANPLVEEDKNQVAVKRGPIVYCLESADISNGKSIDDIAIPENIKLTEKRISIDNHYMDALEGEAILRSGHSWKNVLYRKIESDTDKIKIRLIPYYAWGNRGNTEMTVWMNRK